MEFIFEFLLELVLESSIEVSKSKRVPKYIRYPLIVIISLFFIAVIGVIIFTGIVLLKENMPVGIFFILVGVVFLLMCIIKFRKTYVTKTTKK